MLSEGFGSRPSRTSVFRTNLKCQRSICFNFSPSEDDHAQRIKQSRARYFYFTGNQTSIMFCCDPTDPEVFSIFQLYPESPNDFPIIRASA
jgi:hypothetical protein